VSFKDHDNELQKHPRERGADIAVIAAKGFKVETPPRTRGRHLEHLGFGDGLGNTPANAGQTGIGVSPSSVFQKHPRERGADS